VRIGAAWRELRRASTQALRPLLYGTGPHALDLGQVDTLDLLVQHGPVRMRDLAGALRVDASTATRAVARLVDEGLAERVSAPEDGRVVVVQATTEGTRRHASLAERRRGALIAMLTGLDADERARLADLLERLVDGVDAWVAAERSRAERER
jgi:DNA-binding MarR family transcriptional regulator